MVHPKMKSSRWERRCDWGNEGVPCNFPEYDPERRRDTLYRGSGGSGAYYDSSCDNVGRPPSSVCEIPGEVHRLGSKLSQGSPRGVDRRRCGEWSGVWGSPS